MQETGRNGFIRGSEHLDALRLEDSENASWHHVVDHNEERAEFSMTVLKIHRTALVIQINEAIRIIISKAEFIMNSKTERHQAPLVRKIPVSGLQEEPGTARGSLQQGVERGRGGRGRGRGGDRALRGQRSIRVFGTN